MVSSPSVTCVAGVIEKLIAIVPQHAFVQSGSIRMNITFSASHEETNEERLGQVVRACGLSEDLARLDDGIEYVLTLAQHRGADC